MAASTTLVIAEIGVNHNGSMRFARQLIDMAADAGADAVKFQSFSADALVSQDAPMANYQAERSQASSQHAMLRELELSESQFAELIDYCATRSIEFMSTAFDSVWLKWLVRNGIRRIKWPSGELTNLAFLDEAACFGLPILMSTGMATLEEVQVASGRVLANWLPRGIKRDELTVLHCTSLYPAPDESLNLRALQTLATDLDLPVGYSDHSVGIDAAPVAVALGAGVIEKHLTFDRAAPGPDHHASIEPNQFREMTQAIRRVEKMRGDGRKAPDHREAEVAAVARKSLFTTKALTAGTVLAADNIVARRPGTGIPAEELVGCIGKKVRHDLPAGHQLAPGDFQ